MYIGIDLGGTNIAAGIVDENGRLVAKASVPTGAQREYTEIVRDMAELVKGLAAENGVELSEIEAVGIGSPGSIDSKNGVVVYANNLNMKNAPIAEELRKYIDAPVHIENDANAAAYGEYVVNGGGIDNFVFITLGTGVGGGIIINKKIYTGFNGIGGELGHITLVHGGLPCSCGNIGCWEAYASVTALINQTRAAIAEHPESLMKQLAEKEGKVSGRTAFDAAKENDAAAETVVAQYIEYVASGIVSVINIFQPQKLLIGGGISKEGDRLLLPIKEYCKKHGYNKQLAETEIGIATLFNDAGIIGAAFAAKNM